MAEGLTDAQIIERIERLERNVRMLAERTGSDFLTSQRVVNGI
jgi:hypothetical protein